MQKRCSENTCSGSRLLSEGITQIPQAAAAMFARPMNLNTLANEGECRFSTYDLGFWAMSLAFRSQVPTGTQDNFWKVVAVYLGRSKVLMLELKAGVGIGRLRGCLQHQNA